MRSQKKEAAALQAGCGFPKNPRLQDVAQLAQAAPPPRLTFPDRAPPRGALVCRAGSWGGDARPWRASTLREPASPWVPAEAGVPESPAWSASGATAGIPGLKSAGTQTERGFQFWGMGARFLLLGEECVCACACARARVYLWVCVSVCACLRVCILRQLLMRSGELQSVLFCLKLAFKTLNSFYFCLTKLPLFFKG